MIATERFAVGLSSKMFNPVFLLLNYYYLQDIMMFIFCLKAYLITLKLAN